MQVSQKPLNPRGEPVGGEYFDPRLDPVAGESPVGTSKTCPTLL